MKINKIITAILLMLPAMLLQSCLKDDKEVFSGSATDRMNDFTEKARQTLISAENGWELDLYPMSDQGIGGYVYTLKFDEQTVTVRSELNLDNSTAQEATSLWATVSDDGPVLTFDSYNEIFHLFSTPWQDNGGAGYEAYQGEFEFVIMDVQPDIITIKGKKTGNLLYLRRLEQTATQYMQAVGNIATSFIVSNLDKDFGNHTGIHAELDNENRQIEFVYADTTYVSEDEFTVKGDTVDVAYCFTDRGLRLYKEIEIGGRKIADLDYDEPSLTVKAKGYDSPVITDFKCALPKNYLRYEEIPVGEYQFRFETGGKTRWNVTLEQAGDGRSFLMKGIHERFSVRLDYIRSTGSLSMVAQELVLNPPYDDGYIMWWCPLSATAGDGSRYFSWSTSIGMSAKWNGVSKEKPTFRFADNGNWPSYEVVAFFLAVFEGTEPTSDGYNRRITNYLDPYWNLAGRKSQMKDDPDDESETPRQIEVATSTIEKPYSLVKQ